MGPIGNANYLVVCDAHSKRIKVFSMKSMHAAATVEALQMMISRHGIPQVLVTDNASQLASSHEFFHFCETNGITCKAGAPYHPATNGQAENAVKQIKQIILKASVSKTRVDEAIRVFHLLYHNSPHTTGAMPAFLFLGRLYALV